MNPDGFVHRPGFLSPADEAEIRSRLRTLDCGEFRMRGDGTGLAG